MSINSERKTDAPSGNNGPSTDELRSRLRMATETSLATETNTLISSPTGSGKSYTVATTPWLDYPDLTGGEPVIHVSPTKAARDDAAENSEKAGVTYAVLKGREDTCSVAAGRHDKPLGPIEGKTASEWLTHKCDVEHWQFSWAHTKLNQDLGPLPCTHDGECKGAAQWTNVPRNGEGEPEYDVIHVTSSFANVSTLIENANVFFDEFPDYQHNFDQEHLRNVVTNLLQERGNPTYRWEALLEAAHRQDADLLQEYRELLDGAEYKYWATQGEKTDAKAPDVVRAILNAKPAGGSILVGWSGRTGITLDQTNTLTVIAQPDLTTARCVIGFDAHPSPLRWELSTGLDFTEKTLLSSRENRSWRQRERGLSVVQVGTATRALTSGWRNTNEPEQAEAIIQTLREEHGAEFRTCICPKSIQTDVRRMMEDAGIADAEIMHYGEEKSRNDFGDERVGLVLGCIDPGDHNILGMLGLVGGYAEPEMYDRDDEAGRAMGRGFVGKDADAATELLESVRRDRVAQAIGRYARKIGDPDSGALVYVWSDAIPDDLVDRQISNVKQPTEKQRGIINTLREAEGPMTKTEVADDVGTSRVYAWEVLSRAVEEGIVTVCEGTGKNGADEYEYVSGGVSLSLDLGGERTGA